MRFCVITHVKHKINSKGIFAYEPYVKEMNLWFKHVNAIQVVAPFTNEEVINIDAAYVHDSEPNRDSSFNKDENSSKIESNVGLKIIKVPAFKLTSLRNTILSIIKIPVILLNIFKVMSWAEHIHIRCPGNMGLLGCIVQILFPSKPKTIKYAGNWDPKSQQPWSYRLQKWIISNSLLTKNCKVLVYGEWENQSKNILPFFTASYSEKEIVDVKLRDFKYSKIINESDDDSKNKGTIRFIFVGALTQGKQPLVSIKIIHALLKKGHNVRIDVYGEGAEKHNLEHYIQKHQLYKQIFLHGNQPKELVKKAYKKAHFLLFLSKSEGWPKVVAESMFWGCVPITSNVSSIPFMLDVNERGSIIDVEIKDGVETIEHYIDNEIDYSLKAKKAMDWSRQFTLERFEEEIGKLLSSFQK